jgi:hypothetical protein
VGFGRKAKKQESNDMGILSTIAGLVWSEARKNKFYAEIVYPDHSKRSHLVTLKNNAFIVDKKKYSVDLKDESVITYSGFWRVPGAEYYYNVKEPLKRVQRQNKTNNEGNIIVPISAEDAFDATESHVVSQAFTAFAGEMLSQTTGFLLVICAAVAGPIILYVVFNNKFRDLTELATQVAAAHGITVK